MIVLAIAVLFASLALSGAILGAAIVKAVMQPKPPKEPRVSSRLGDKLFFYEVPRHLEAHITAAMRRLELIPVWRGVTNGRVYLCFDGVQPTLAR